MNEIDEDEDEIEEDEIDNEKYKEVEKILDMCSILEKLKFYLGDSYYEIVKNKKNKILNQKKIY